MGFTIGSIYQSHLRAKAEGELMLKYDLVHISRIYLDEDTLMVCVYLLDMITIIFQGKLPASQKEGETDLRGRTHSLCHLWASYLNAAHLFFWLSQMSSLVTEGVILLFWFQT